MINEVSLECKECLGEDGWELSSILAKVKENGFENEDRAG